MRPLIRLLLLFSLSWLATASHADIAVIVHPDAHGTPTRTDVINIYLGLDRSLTPTDLQEWTYPRTEFYQDLVRKNPAQLKSYWAALIFTGKGRPPKAVRNQATMLEQVAANPRAIGYVDSALVDERVRILFLLD